jgi:hypothetical protein
MRSHLPDIVDCGNICSLFGGGGHKAAAAFPQEYKFFSNLCIQNVNLKKDLKNMNLL